MLFYNFILGISSIQTFLLNELMFQDLSILKFFITVFYFINFVVTFKVYLLVGTKDGLKLNVMSIYSLLVGASKFEKT